MAVGVAGTQAAVDIAGKPDAKAVDIQNISADSDYFRWGNSTYPADGFLLGAQAFGSVGIDTCQCDSWWQH